MTPWFLSSTDRLNRWIAWHSIGDVKPSDYELIDLKSSDSRATIDEPTDGQSADTQCTNR
jgi:hypothetical protein